MFSMPNILQRSLLDTLFTYVQEEITEEDSPESRLRMLSL
jgi:hypothetical protein